MANFNEKNTITIPIQYKSFVYFLIKNNEVIYVGQTRNNLSRPFQHKDKDFDRLEIMLCDEKELDFLENKYIIKYQPKYNSQINNGYKVITARNKLRKMTNSLITIRDIKKIMKIKNINFIKVGSNDYLNNESLIKIYKYLLENING